MVEGGIHHAVVGENQAAGGEGDHAVDGVECYLEDEAGRSGRTHADAGGNVAADAGDLAAEQKVVQQIAAVVLGMAGGEKGADSGLADGLGEADPLRRHRH